MNFNYQKKLSKSKKHIKKFKTKKQSKIEMAAAVASTA
jgi:hypothetical protein